MRSDLFCFLILILLLLVNIVLLMQFPFLKFKIFGCVFLGGYVQFINGGLPLIRKQIDIGPGLSIHLFKETERV